MSVEILTDDDFQHHHKSELYDNEEIKGRLDPRGPPCTDIHFVIDITVSFVKGFLRFYELYHLKFSTHMYQ